MASCRNLLLLCIFLAHLVTFAEGIAKESKYWSNFLNQNLPSNLAHVVFFHLKPGLWQIGSAFVFCPGDHLFESEPIPPWLMYVVGMCSTRGGSQGMYSTLASAKSESAKPTLVLKTIGTSPEIQNRGTSCPKKDMSPPKTLKNKYVIVTM